ncbi:hypothetical protein C3L33_15585, partial [Rhododendron williamsianum]
MRGDSPSNPPNLAAICRRPSPAILAGRLLPSPSPLFSSLFSSLPFPSAAHLSPASLLSRRLLIHCLQSQPIHRKDCGSEVRLYEASMIQMGKSALYFLSDHMKSRLPRAEEVAIMQRQQLSLAIILRSSCNNFKNAMTAVRLAIVQGHGSSPSDVDLGGKQKNLAEMFQVIFAYACALFTYILAVLFCLFNPACSGVLIIPIAVIASFREMRRLTQDRPLIVATLKESSFLFCTVLVENLPEDQSTENIQSIFGEAGNIKNICIRDPHAARELQKRTIVEKLLSVKVMCQVLLPFDDVSPLDRHQAFYCLPKFQGFLHAAAMTGSHSINCVDFSKLKRGSSRILYVGGHALESSLQLENCIPVKPWKLEADDTALVDLIPFLECALFKYGLINVARHPPADII